LKISKMQILDNRTQLKQIVWFRYIVIHPVFEELKLWIQIDYRCICNSKTAVNALFFHHLF
jgi:hypothetical protein